MEEFLWIKKAIFMTADECLEVFKKYDKSFYEYWKDSNFYEGFGIKEKLYAEYLLKINEPNT